MELALPIASYKQFCVQSYNSKWKIKVDHPMFQLPILPFILKFSLMELLLLLFFEFTGPQDGPQGP